MSISNITAGYGYTPTFNNNGVGTTTLNLSSNKQALSPNLAPLDKDTVNFKGQTNQKKKGMSTFGKICLGLLGIGAAAYAGVVTYRFATKPSIDKVAQNFSEIFRKDVSKEEAQKMVNEYKEIFKEDDVDKFCTKIFEQTKNNYGFKNADIKLKIEKMPDFNRATIASKGDVAAYQAQTGIMRLNPIHTKNNIIIHSEKEKMFEAIIHEFQHAKQSEIAYKTNLDKYVDAMEKRHIKNNANLCENLIEKLNSMLDSDYEIKKYMKDNNFKTIEEAKKTIKRQIETLKNSKEVLNNSINFDKSKCKNRLIHIWGDIPSLKEGTQEYNLGLKYIDNEANYVTFIKDNYNEYHNQLVEAEAFGTESKAKEIYKYFANPWRIF